VTRTIYFGDGGSPPVRALALPTEREIAAAFASPSRPDPGDRVVTRTIRFR
jgi:hypothetical protein